MPRKKDTHVIPGGFNYFKELSPVNLNYVAALNSIEPINIDKDFTYCDLSCGNGLTINICAASYPQGKFFGIDADPEHIHHAQSTAKKAGLNNVTFLCHTLSESSIENLPGADFIVLHNVFSYTSENTRNQILKIIRKKLNPQGLFYVNYNAMPGWAISMPLREAVKQYTDNITGNAREKVKEGLSYLKLLSLENTEIFSKNLTARRYLDSILQESHDYVAYEYLQEYCHAFYFKDVNSFFKTIDMEFVGSMPFYLNHKPFTIPQECIKYYGSVDDREFLEMQKDFIANSFFRQDIYANNKKHTLTPTERDNYFKHCYFAQINYYEKITKKVVINKQNFTLTGNVYKRLQELFRDGIYSITELCDHSYFNTVEESIIATAIRNLTAFGLISPCQKKGILGKPTEIFHQLGITHSMNKNLKIRIDQETQEVALASQVLGGAVKINPISAIILLAYTQNKNKAEIIHQVAQETIMQMKNPPIDKNFFQRKITHEVENFSKNILPILYRLGIVTVKN